MITPRWLAPSLVLLGCNPTLTFLGPTGDAAADASTLDAALPDAPPATDLGAPPDAPALPDSPPPTDAPAPPDVRPPADAGCTACGPRDVCRAGVCVDRCDPLALDRTSLGCTFWSVTLPNSQLDPGFSFAVALANPQAYAVTATVQGGALATPRRVLLAAGATEVVELPWVPELVQTSATNTGCRDNPTTPCAGGFPVAGSAQRRAAAYRVDADGPIAAYQFNPLSFSRGEGYLSYSNDASLLLPRQSLGAEHLVATAPNWIPAGSTIQPGGYLAVVGTSETPTQVTVRAAGDVRAGGGVAAMRAGETRTFALAASEVLLLVGENAGTLTGTRVTSDRPVAVFGGHDCANVPASRAACDHLEEQLPPVAAWGREVIVAPLRDRPATASLVRVTSAVDGNVVRFEPAAAGPAATLGAGQSVEVSTAAALRVTGTGPLLVAQFMVGGGQENPTASEGDPAMTYEVPTEQYQTRYDVFVPATYPRNFLACVLRNGGTIRLDGAELRGSLETVGDWSVLTAVVSAGAHRVESGDGTPISVKVYGVARYTSYLMPGGAGLRPL